MAERRHEGRQSQSQQEQQQQRTPQQQGGQQPGGQQQGGQASPRQQQQFDPQGNRQSGGGAGSDARLADQIRPHMDVVDDNGGHVGTVDHVDGDRVKLTRDSSPDGEHHYVPLSQVAGIEGGKLRLRQRGDTTFGQASSGG